MVGYSINLIIYYYLCNVIAVFLCAFNLQHGVKPELQTWHNLRPLTCGSDTFDEYEMKCCILSNYKKG